MRITKLLAAAACVFALAACSENEAATKKCKDEKSADACETCCKDNGANGYKYMGDGCGCLGG